MSMKRIVHVWRYTERDRRRWYWLHLQQIKRNGLRAEDRMEWMRAVLPLIEVR